MAEDFRRRLFAHSLMLFVIMIVDAARTTGSNITSLQHRQTIADPSCDRQIPGSSHFTDTYYDNTTELFNNVQEILRFATFSHFERSTAYSHYFRPEDHDRVMRMFERMADGIDDDGSVAIRYACGSDMKPSQCNGFEIDVFSIVDRYPSGWIIFCDKFFNHYRVGTRNTIQSRPFNDKAGGWCRESRRDFQSIVVGEEVVLHQVSQLNDVAQSAGLPPS